MPGTRQNATRSQDTHPAPNRHIAGSLAPAVGPGTATGVHDPSVGLAQRLGHNLARVAVDRAPPAAVQRQSEGTAGGPGMAMASAIHVTPAADTTVVQRYTDVKAAYDYPNRPQDEQSWLDDYAEIQALLADRQRIKPHLQALANRMVERDIDLSAALATFEAGTWAAAHHQTTVQGRVERPGVSAAKSTGHRQQQRAYHRWRHDFHRLHGGW